MLSSDRHTTALNKQSYTKKKLASNQTTYERKILFVSGLRSDVRADDIRRHFTGCVKVKIKQNKIIFKVYYRNNKDMKNKLVSF